jgi:UTP:GlnB (protein PII) uridylyltransferase
VSLLDDASDTATVVEVRAHDAPGLLWRVGRALGECGLDVRAARVETLGAEVVDVFYVTDGDGKLLAGDDQRRMIAHSVLAALGDLTGESPPGLSRRQDAGTTDRPVAWVLCLRPFLTG